MAVWIEERVGRTVAEVAVEPATIRSGRLERCDAPLERRDAVRAIGDVPDPRLRRRTR